MPEENAAERARRDAQEGKSPSTQAGEFVRQENRTHTGGKTWRALSPASDRHRTFQGAVGRDKPATASFRPMSQKVRRQAERDLSKGRRGASHPSRSRS